MEPFQVAAYLWAVGDGSAESLPDVATNALLADLDSPSLRELAGTRRDDFWTIKRLFEVSLEELGVELPDEQTALWRLAQHKAEQVLTGEVSPASGAEWIWAKIYYRIHREGDLRVFVGLASELDDHPDIRHDIESQIVEAARTILSRDEPRKWLRLDAQTVGSSLLDSRTLAPIRIDELPISERLIAAVASWEQEFTALMSGSTPGFDSPEQAFDFVERGRGLVSALQDELGSSWHVEYMPEPTRPPGLRLRNRR